MWIILFLLWLLPLLLAIVLGARVLGGSAAVTEDEWRWIFRDTRKMRLSIWMIISFAVFGIIFFFVGFLEATVLRNLSSFWLVIVPLITGLAAVLLIALWLRTGAREKPVLHRHTLRRRASHRRFSDLLSR